MERISEAMRRVVPHIPRQLSDDESVVLAWFFNHPANPYSPELTGCACKLSRERVVAAMATLAENNLLDVSGRRVKAWLR